MHRMVEIYKQTCTSTIQVHRILEVNFLKLQPTLTKGGGTPRLKYMHLDSFDSKFL